MPSAPFDAWRGALSLGSFFIVSALVGCRVPRQVHEPREYPPIVVQARAAVVVVVDAREPGTDPSQRQLALPADFEVKAQARLAATLAGQGPELGVIIGVAAADELPVVDARGEMTRVLVRLSIEIKPVGGAVLRRAETQSTSDLPRDEATPEEVAFVLEATAIDAFDRYFADARVLEGINRDLGAYAQRP